MEEQLSEMKPNNGSTRKPARPLLRALPVGLLAAAATLALVLAACGGGGDGGDGLSGEIVGDGSSTVFPISEAVAEAFREVEGGVDVVVGLSGTGGGFEKFCGGETDFNDASRPIKDEEKQACAGNGIEWVEFQVAYDGLSLMVNPDNDFVDCLTVEELKKIWEPGSKVDSWDDVRPEFPDEGIKLYGPGTDSGTFDYFTDEIVGEEGASRADYTPSEDDNVLVQGVAGDKGSLGYFGFAYYEQNTDKLKLLGVDGGSGCIQPTRQTILDGTYSPLSRPLFVYVRKDSLDRTEVAEFMRFYLTGGPDLVAQVGYVEAPDAVYQEGLALLP